MHKLHFMVVLGSTAAALMVNPLAQDRPLVRTSAVRYKIIFSFDERLAAFYQQQSIDKPLNAIL